MSFPLSMPIAGPLSYPIARYEGVGGGVDAYFARVASGARWGFADLTRLFVENTGGTQVAAAGNAIGLFLDNRQWGGKTLAQLVAAQPELISNPGPFVNTTGITAANASLSVSGGILTIAATSSNSGRAEWTLSGLEVGSVYETKVRARRASGTNQRITNWTWTTVPATAFTDSFADYTFRLQATATTGLLRLYGSSTVISSDVLEVESLSVKKIPGNHGPQATGGARGSYQSGGILRVATDDGYPTPMLPGKFLMARAKLNGGSGNRALAGASGSATARFNLYFNTSGQAACRVGDGAEQAAGADRTGVDGTIGLRVNASTVDLVIDGVVADTAALSGTPTTTQAVAVGYINNNGTPGSYFTGDFLTGLPGDAILAGDVIPSDGELAAMHAHLMRA